MTVRNALLGAVAAATAVALTACGAQGTPAAEDDGKIKVVASTNVWGSVVEAVGGDAVEVGAIIDDPSGDPHSYESKPSDLAAVRDADLVIFNGGGYDDFFATLLGPDTEAAHKEAARKIEAFTLSGKASDHEEPGASAEPETDEAGHDHSVNEHVWYDFATVRKVADQAAADLGAIAPDRKAAFEGNAERFDAQLTELEQRVAGKGAGKKVLATEPVAHYLLDTAGVEDVTPESFSDAVENETDIPAAALADVTRLVEQKQVTALVNNAQTENAATKQVVEGAKAAGLPVAEVTETLPEGVTGYLDWMTKQVDSLVGALGT
ncbi:zinc ABC transporter substrate-binding protein [Actinosynnema sp. NPDC023658]|uniref:metal ABC transporter solute-binding protein, Zn/Mn family n=1 Tax=Actinosynnema sp. NPDC023658 TaxID=3155465 RepID=UPI0033D810B5